MENTISSQSQGVTTYRMTFCCHDPADSPKSCQQLPGGHELFSFPFFSGLLPKQTCSGIKTSSTCCFNIPTIPNHPALPNHGVDLQKYHGK